VNAKECSLLLTILFVLMTGSVRAKSAKNQISEGNVQYQQGNYEQAVEAYEQVLRENPKNSEAQFNKANALYRQKEFDAAIDSYQKAAVQSKNTDLISKAKYNLGNSYFNRGLKQENDPQKAIESFESGIDCWRQVQQLRPDNPVRPEILKWLA